MRLSEFFGQRNWLSRAQTVAAKLRHRLRPTTIQYTTAAPNPQQTLDIMAGAWRSQLPPPFEPLQAGKAGLFVDGRITWLIEQLGGVSGLNILELGPLEGGHSYMLSQAGAKQVTAIEANSQAYLKCLIVKELLDLTNVRFLYGDFLAYLRESEAPSVPLTGDDRGLDLCVASGVLYHLQNPVELIALIAQHRIRHLFLWTQYYDPVTMDRQRHPVHKMSGQIAAEHAGFRHTLYRREYRAGRFLCGFSGAGTSYSHWMKRADILDALAHFGYGDIQVAFDEPNVNGPAFAVLATYDS